MKAGFSAIERAFELARAGKVESFDRIISVLNREGYSTGDLVGRTLRKQLREIIKTAREKAVERQ